MKKYIALLLVLVMAFSFAACAPAETPDTPSNTPVATPTPEQTPEATPEATPAPEQTPEATPEQVPAEPVVMSYAEYIAAPMDSQVVVECYVQGHQSWWDNKITVYAQDEDGAYFLYEMACSEEDAAKLTPGTAIRVTGYKGQWAGEVEIMDATFEFIEGSYIAAPVDATAWLGTDELIAHQNELVSFTGMTVEAIEYKNGEPGDDIYVTLGNGGASYSFCVEVYLTGPDTEVYTTVGSLAVGDTVDVQGFLYWYEGPNPHITAITKTASAPAAEPETSAEGDELVFVTEGNVTIHCYGTVTEGATIPIYGYEEVGTRIDLVPGSTITAEVTGENAYFYAFPYKWNSEMGAYIDSVEALAVSGLNEGPVDEQFGILEYDGYEYQVDAYFCSGEGLYFFCDTGAES